MLEAKIFSQPITSMLGVRISENPDYLLHLPFTSNLTNHVDVMHAAAIYGFAELSNGYCLNLFFPEYSESTVPLLRKSSAKYKQVVKGDLFSQAEIVNSTVEELREQLEKKRKVHVDIEVRLYDEHQQEVFRCLFEWFVTFVKPQLAVSGSE